MELMNTLSFQTKALVVMLISGDNLRIVQPNGIVCWARVLQQI